MAATGLHDVVTALVSGLRAETGYGAPSTAGIIPVFDGPAPTGLSVPKFIVVGDDGDGNAGEESADWHTLGPTAEREVEGTVNVLCVAWGGTDDALAGAAAKRAEAAALLATVEKVAHEMSTLTSSTLVGCRLDGGVWRQESTEAGPVCSVTARVFYRTLLTTWS